MNEVNFGLLANRIASLGSSTDLQLLTLAIGVELEGRRSPYKSHRGIGFFPGDAGANGHAVPDCTRVPRYLQHGELLVSNGKYLLGVETRIGDAACPVRDELAARVVAEHPSISGRTANGDEALRLAPVSAVVPASMVTHLWSVENLPPGILPTAAGPLIGVVFATPVRVGWRETTEEERSAHASVSGSSLASHYPVFEPVFEPAPLVPMPDEPEWVVRLVVAARAAGACADGLVSARTWLARQSPDAAPDLSIETPAMKATAPEWAEWARQHLAPEAFPAAWRPAIWTDGSLGESARDDR